MMINVSDLLKKKITVQELDVTLDLSKFDDGTEIIEVAKDITFNGAIKWLDEDLFLEGNIKGILVLTCSRCIEKFNYELNLNIRERISTNTDDKDDELIFIDNSKLNLHGIIIDNIIMSLPVKRLCREDCKGLCQVCGANLNYVTCNCKGEDVDPRLAKLKDFFSAN